MIPTTTNKMPPYSCDGVQTVFPFTFKIFEKTDIWVVLTDSDGQETILTYLSDYDVTADNDDFTSGGNVETFETYESGYKLTILRVLDLTQLSDYINNEKFPAETFETDLDKIVCICQQIKEEVLRTLKYAVSDTEASGELPTKIARASKFFAWDEDGNPIPAEGISEVPVSPFMATVLDDLTADAARTTLEVYSKNEVDDISENIDQVILSFTAGEDISNLNVLVKNGTANEVIKGNNTDINKLKVVGIAITSATTGNSVKVKEVGIISGFSGLTPGGYVYLGTSGGITQTQPSTNVVLLGYAVSATSIFFLPHLLYLNYEWQKVTNPGTGWFASKTAGWTADSFSGGWEIDFDSVTPNDAIAVLVAFKSDTANSYIYARKEGDSNISNTPHADSEYSALIGRHVIGANTAVFRTVLWLSSNYKTEIAITNIAVDLYATYPEAILALKGSVT